VTRPLVVSIGTTHPWDIAGVGLDVRVAAEYGVSHATAVAAVSAQDARGLHDLHVIPPQSLKAQLSCLPTDIAAFRIGAMGSSENVRVVAAYLREHASSAAIVVDPVIAVTLGGELSADDDVMETIDEALLPLAIVITPNVTEAAQLTGRQVRSIDEMRAAGQWLVARGARGAYVKGGHLDGDPIDVLVSAQGEQIFVESRLDGSMRGSGCTLAAALACELAVGRDLPTAAGLARAYVRTKIAAHTLRGGLQVAF
jgi:hydroxymethylpyrimidine/phosphomethylpyrimidine kinase